MSPCDDVSFDGDNETDSFTKLFSNEICFDTNIKKYFPGNFPVYINLIY